MKGDARREAISREVRIDAPAETVFAFLTDPEKYARWKGRRAELDPRPGGIFRVEFGPGKGVVRGTFVEVVPHRRVVFSWGWEGSVVVPPGASLVAIELVADGKGTILRLVHTGLPVPELASHTAGWDHFLPRLATVALGGDVPSEQN